MNCWICNYMWGYALFSLKTMWRLQQKTLTRIRTRDLFNYRARILGIQMHFLLTSHTFPVKKDHLTQYANIQALHLAYCSLLSWMHPFVLGSVEVARSKVLPHHSHHDFQESKTYQSVANWKIILVENRLSCPVATTIQLFKGCFVRA